MTKKSYRTTARTAHAISLLGFALAAAAWSWSAPAAYAQAGLTYVEGENGKYAPANLTPSAAFVEVTGNDDKWWLRETAFGAEGTVFESVFEQPPELTQTISGLAAGSYDVYLVHWTNVNEDWTIAGSLTPNAPASQWKIYNNAGPNGTFPSAVRSIWGKNAVWAAPPLDATLTTPYFQNGNQELLLGKVGTATAVGGQISVHINDPGGAGAGSRTWYDGLAYAPAGTAITLTATINRDTGNLTITNGTTQAYQIKSYSITSSSGSLNSAAWTNIANNSDGDSGAEFDSDLWSVTAPAPPTLPTFTTQLSEAEAAGAVTIGATLASGSSLNLGDDVWHRSPFENVSIEVTLADDTAGPPAVRSKVIIVPEYVGSEASVADFNGDGTVDIANDFSILTQNLHGTLLSGLTAVERFRLGDITGNAVVNANDYAAFRTAYDDANGLGSFAAAIGVPEPTGLALAALALGGLGLRSARRRSAPRADRPRYHNVEKTSMKMSQRVGALTAAMLAVASLATSATAVPVTGWQVDPILQAARPAPPLAGTASASPTLGDGTANSADNHAIWAPFSTMALANGEQITLSGSVTMLGTVPTNGNMRIGLFKDDGAAPATGGWRGYVMDSGSGGSGGAMVVRNPAATDFATATFVSTTGGRGVSVAAPVQTDVLLSDGTYQFELTASRYGNEIELTGSILGPDGFSNIFPSSSADYPPGNTFDETTAIPAGFQFDRVGFLSGDALQADQMSYANVDVSKSAFSALSLEVTTSGPNAGKMQIVNNSGASFDMSYYQIVSATGSLDLGGWTSLDDQEGDPTGIAWEEAGGSTGLVLSEANAQGATTLTPTSQPLNLGTAFDSGGFQDLRFHYGLPDGTLIRGMVEYVAGPSDLPGDFNGDQVVNGADLTEWKADFGVDDDSDADDDGDSDGQDFLIWQRNVGDTGVTAAASAVPEPAALALAAIALAPLAARRRVARHR